ncbi:Retrovirus-related Pol polyprotein from transposon RE1 [Senna tora]|uniref:Retrovirus-related Pol polyprotein from transposon RE1 n=1 Tax=Senna tora TaxID=362788 RepID=A0A834VZN3_9FABA|nr:Retrovirus-related Pol polyprotein from transposon RE1 [Senna tora]
MKSEENSIAKVEAMLSAQEARLETVKEAVDSVSTNIAQTKNSSQNSKGSQSFGASTSNGPKPQLFGRGSSFRAASLPQSQNQFPRGNQNPQIEANFTTPETLFDPSWFPDTSATNHMTNDLTNLQDTQKYLKVKVDNGLYVFNDLPL